MGPGPLLGIQQSGQATGDRSDVCLGISVPRTACLPMHALIMQALLLIALLTHAQPPLALSRHHYPTIHYGPGHTDCCYTRGSAVFTDPVPFSPFPLAHKHCRNLSQRFHRLTQTSRIVADKTPTVPISTRSRAIHYELQREERHSGRSHTADPVQRTRHPSAVACEPTARNNRLQGSGRARQGRDGQYQLDPSAICSGLQQRAHQVAYADDSVRLAYLDASA